MSIQEVLQTLPARDALLRYRARLSSAKNLWQELRRLNHADARRSTIQATYLELTDVLDGVKDRQMRLAVSGAIYRGEL